MTVPFPEWNELPDDFRVKFAKEGAYYVCDGGDQGKCCGGDCFGGECSMAMYRLFAEKLSEFLPQWLRQKQKELACGDLLAGPYP